MAQPTPKLTPGEAKALAAVAKRASPSGQTIELSFGNTTGAIGQHELVVLVLSSTGTVVRRAEIAGHAGADAVATVLRGIELAAARLAVRPALPAPPLAPSDASLLDEAGLVEGADGKDPLERTRMELDLLLSCSWSLDDAAHKLKVSPGRLRQRLGERTLYGIKVARAWRIPQFQFAKPGRLVRDIGKVLPAVSAGAHPLSVVTWFTSPHQDLVVGGDEKQVTPIAWLEAGLDVDVVVQLAAEV